jgi:hypothetical protein
VESKGAIVGPVVDAGVDALVATLQHKSPHCAAAAACTLGLLATPKVCGQAGTALIQASGAIAALVHLIERRPMIGDPDFFCRWGPAFLSRCLSVVHIVEICHGGLSAELPP